MKERRKYHATIPEGPVVHTHRGVYVVPDSSNPVGSPGTHGIVRVDLVASDGSCKEVYFVLCKTRVV